jgi:RHS repeat-associated protein
MTHLHARRNFHKMKHPRLRYLPAALFSSAVLFLALAEAGRGAPGCRKTGSRTWTETHSYCPPSTGGGGFDPLCEEISGSSEEVPYEVWQYTETTSLCFSGDCAPGQMSTSLESELVNSGTMFCTTASVVPLPWADPALCGEECDCATCFSDSGTGSLWYKMRLSLATKQEDAAFLWIYQKDAATRLYTPAVLALRDEKGLKVYRRPDHVIRQVLSRDYLADVVVTGPEVYEVRLHPVPGNWERQSDAEGYLVPPGDPVRIFRFSNPKPGALDGLRVETVVGRLTKVSEFSWDLAENRWTLAKAADANEREESIESYDEENQTLTKTSRDTDLASGATRDTVRVFRDYAFGRRLLSTETLVGGKRLRKDVYGYGEEPGRSDYGRLVSRQLHDGSWERFEYDSRGRFVKRIAPWKDSPFDSPEEEAKVETYAYLDLDPASPLYHPAAQFVRIDERIAGTGVATTYRLHTRDPADGSVLRIEERAALPGAPFGDERNARTLSRYYPEREADPASGLLRSTESPDGRLVAYRYESGDYTGEEGVPGVFQPRIGGSFLRTVRIETTLAHPDGLGGRSLAEISVEAPDGTLLLEETRLLGDGDPAEGELVGWTGHAYDADRRKLLTRDATGIIAEYRYNPCCAQLEWQRDRDGVETTYVRDADERVTARIVKAPGRPEVETHYEYGPFGQVLSETVVAGDLVQETKHEYDAEGERIATTTPDGLVTRFEHDHANRSHTTILPGGATQVETRYRDGQVKARTGTALVARHYDYGVDPATGDRWTQTSAAKADGPRWSRGTIDALGRSIRQETPGHGEGVVLAAHTAYDEKGRVIANQAGWVRPSVGADDEKGSAFHPLGPITLQTYDPGTGEPLLSGQDLDGDGQLTPGKDRLTKSERRFEEIAGAWWEVSRQWSYPLGLKGQPSLVSEQRRRLTGLGTVHPRDPALGVLVGENVTIQPPASENAGGKNENLVSRSLTYRHRESGLVTTLSADPRGLVSVQTSQGGVVTTVAEKKGLDGEICCEHHFAYDALGRRISVRDPRTGESKTVYDPATGRLAAEIDPENRVTRYGYYPADHSSSGRLAVTVNAEGKEQHVAYTPRGEQRAVWGESVQPLLYDYNEYGERVGMRTFQTTPEGDPSHHEDAGAKTAWHYHEATGSLLRKEYADGKGPEYAYNEAGQLKERRWAREGEGPRMARMDTDETKARRLATLYEYDPATLQLAKSTATDGTEVYYEYDAEGRLAKVTDATGTREFAYDLRGQVTKETVVLQPDPAADPIGYEIRRTYTALGQPESVHLVGADGQPLALDHRIDYGWNDHGQLASVKSLAGEFVYGYDESNSVLLTKMTGPVHEVETSYEPHRNLIAGVVNKAKPRGVSSRLPASPTPAPAADSEPSTKNQEPRTLSSYLYANDLLGRRETISQGGEAFGMLKLGANQVEVAYNDRSEVVGAAYRSGGEVRQRFAYDYDAIGNRQRAASEVGGRKSEVSYEVNALNQYATIQTTPAAAAGSGQRTTDQGPSTPRHDADGNLIEDARNRYTWNADNNLVRVEARDGSLRLDYVYDYQSRRTVRVETTSPGKDTESRRTTYYLYDDWNLLAELESSTGSGASEFGLRVSSFLTWGRDLSGSLQGAGGVGGLLAITKRNAINSPEQSTKNQERRTDGETRFAIFDANGNIVQLIDEGGLVVAAYAYDPFGNVTEMVGAEAAGNPWRFGTKPAEEGTGWLYYGYRWYDAGMGRWVNRDPIEEAGGTNLHSLSVNSSLNDIDVLGFAYLKVTWAEVVTTFLGHWVSPNGSKPFKKEDSERWGAWIKGSGRVELQARTLLSSIASGIINRSRSEGRFSEGVSNVQIYEGSGVAALFDIPYTLTLNGTHYRISGTASKIPNCEWVLFTGVRHSIFDIADFHPDGGPGYTFTDTIGAALQRSGASTPLAKVSGGKMAAMQPFEFVVRNKLQDILWCRTGGVFENTFHTWPR